MKSDFIDAYKSLGQAYRYSESAFHHLFVFYSSYIECFYLGIESYLSILDNMFLSLPSSLRELGDFESAMESFQKALMLDQNHIQSLQLRGMMLYHHGSLQEAIGNFKVL